MLLYIVEAKKGCKKKSLNILSLAAYLLKMNIHDMIKICFKLKFYDLHILFIVFELSPFLFELRNVLAKLQLVSRIISSFWVLNEFSAFSMTKILLLLFVQIKIGNTLILGTVNF